MSLIRPFKGLRPSAELCSKVAALPYDVMTSEEAREMVKDNPYSFLHIDRAEIDLPVGTNPYSSAVYKKAKENLNKMIEEGIYIRDEEPCFYIYRLTRADKSQTGLVACTSIDEYINNKIKKHELTRADKELDRINHVDKCNANTGPIFLTYKNRNKIDTIIADCTEKKPLYDFKAEDGVTHTVWLVEKEYTEPLIEEFKNVPALYIADGHHRNMSAVKVGLKRREENPNYRGNEEFNYYLSVIFPSDQLYIMDYNRVVKDLNGYSTEDFLAEVRKKFDVKECKGKDCFKPKEMHSFGMYVDGKWYSVKAKGKIINNNDCIACLDVSILQNEILSPILGIKDPRTDKRIDFVGGIRGLDELKKRVDSGEMAVAFSMFPTTMDQLMNIADEDKIMPPKSTWFEPKPRSGIFIHEL